ncbi:MAG: class I SAM-dependent methyltransferase [Bacteroidota bacterium]
MPASNQDIWSQWILHRRFGGDERAMQESFEKYLYPWRDRILDRADIKEGETLLDVGCGDGLIAFGALERTKTGTVIFSDISQDLLDHSQKLAQQMGLLERCRFLKLSAEDLSSLANGSVDVVTTRSVLIYVPAKQKALQEFYRVLRPGGRLSIFEPINRFGWPEPDDRFGGYDATPVKEIALKVKGLFDRIQPPDEDPMLDFDERDLLRFAEAAGFREVHLDLQAEIRPPDAEKWETIYRSAANPKVPSLEEAVKQVLTPEEARRFIDHLRPLAKAGQGMQRRALAFLWAVK